MTAKNTALLITRAYYKTKTITEHTQQGCSLQRFNNTARNGYLSLSQGKEENDVHCLKWRIKKEKEREREREGGIRMANK